jgi:sugar (pentulose or hexulose) kinase
MHIRPAGEDQLALPDVPNYHPSMQYLGVDIGSSSIKGGILDLAAGEVRGVVKEPFPDPLAGRPAGHFEVPMTPIIEGVDCVIAELLTLAPDAKGVLVSSQMGGVVVIDDAGQPVSNYLSWRDQRTLQPHRSGRSYLEEVRSRWSDAEFAELGRELQPGSATTLLFWLSENGQLPRSAGFASVGNAALAQLCGAVPQMHPTEAIGLLNLHERDWHRPALAKLGLEHVRCPAIADEVHPIGRLQPPFPPIPCYAAFGDQQCALYGASLAEDELSINISTGSQVSRRTATAMMGEYQTRAYFDGGWLNTITHLPAGRSLNVLFDLLTELPRRAGVTLDDPWGLIGDALRAADGGGLMCDLAFFKGPFGERGGISGITTENLSVGNLFHAAIEAMVENYSRCVERIWPARDWQRIALTGGLTHALPKLRDQIATRIGHTLREPTASEETLLGLLKVGLRLGEN